jgi:hypothetical protein
LLLPAEVLAVLIISRFKTVNARHRAKNHQMGMRETRVTKVMKVMRATRVTKGTRGMKAMKGMKEMKEMRGMRVLILTTVTKATRAMKAMREMKGTRVTRVMKETMATKVMRATRAMRVTRATRAMKVTRAGLAGREGLGHRKLSDGASGARAVVTGGVRAVHGHEAGTPGGFQMLVQARCCCTASLHVHAHLVSAVLENSNVQERMHAICKRG